MSSICLISCTLAWDQAPRSGNKGKKRGQIGKISAIEASLAQTTSRIASLDFFFSPTTVFFSLFTQCGVWSHLPAHVSEHQLPPYFRLHEPVTLLCMSRVVRILCKHRALSGQQIAYDAKLNVRQHSKPKKTS